MTCTTTTATFSQAVELNKRGISQLSQGCCHEAIATFGAALHITRQLMIDCTDDEGPSSLSIDACMDQSSILEEEKLALDDKLAANTTYIYRHPIAIPEGLELKHDSRILGSIILIFNLALAYQLGAENSDLRLVHLKKAAKLYELAHKLYIDEQYIVDSTTFIMATVNNLGLIYQGLHDVATAHRCFEHLLQTLMFLVDCGVPDVATKLAGFFRNTTHVLCQQVTAAAA